jgi:hypothetical protein
MSGCICNDCGIDTTPRTGLRGWRSGKHTGKYAYRRRTDMWEYYVVTDKVWEAAGIDGNFLCIGCLEQRIGRQLTSNDFTDAPINKCDKLGSTPRLRERLKHA